MRKKNKLLTECRWSDLHLFNLAQTRSLILTMYNNLEMKQNLVNNLYKFTCKIVQLIIRPMKGAYHRLALL